MYQLLIKWAEKVENCHKWFVYLKSFFVIRDYSTTFFCLNDNSLILVERFQSKLFNGRIDSSGFIFVFEKNN